MCRLAMTIQFVTRPGMVLAVACLLARPSVAEEEGLVRLQAGGNCPPPAISAGEPAVYPHQGWNCPPPANIGPYGAQSAPAQPMPTSPDRPGTLGDQRAQALLPPVSPLANLGVAQQADGGINLASGTALGERSQGAFHEMISDFFGGSTSEATILPGALVDQAVLFQQPSNSPLLSYYRSVTPLLPSGFATNASVYLGVDSAAQPQSVTPNASPPQTLSQFAGATFVGNPVTLGPITNPGPFISLDSGTVGDVNAVATEGVVLLAEPIYNVYDALFVYVPSPGAGGTVGRQKIAENGRVVPSDRVFVNNSVFTNVPLTSNGVDVYRFVPGFEIAFQEDLMSVEVRVPFAVSLDSDIIAGGVTDTNSVEFGNVVTTLKMLLARTDDVAIGAGVSLAYPTASDISVKDVAGTPLLNIENQALHVLPYVGGAHTQGRLSAQGFLQADIGANGNTTSVRNLETGLLEESGKLNDAAFLFASASLAYWLYQDVSISRTYEQACGTHYKSTTYSVGNTFLTGFAPIVEFHWNRSLQQSDAVYSGPIQISNVDKFSLTNVVLGGLFTFGTGGSLNVAWAAPLIGRDDRQFDSEFRLILNFEL